MTHARNPDNVSFVRREAAPGGLRSSPTERMATSWRVVVPGVLLVATAAAQMSAAHASTLSAWKGGGFGMFSTLDAPGFRDIRIRVEAPGRSEMVAVSPSLEDAAARAAAWPTDARLRRLADAVIAREQRQGRDVARVLVDVVRRTVAGDGVVSRVRLHGVVVHAVAGHAR